MLKAVAPPQPHRLCPATCDTAMSHAPERGIVDAEFVSVATAAEHRLTLVLSGEESTCPTFNAKCLSPRRRPYCTEVTGRLRRAATRGCQGFVSAAASSCSDLSICECSAQALDRRGSKTRDAPCGSPQCPEFGPLLCIASFGKGGQPLLDEIHQLLHTWHPTVEYRQCKCSRMSTATVDATARKNKAMLQTF